MGVRFGSQYSTAIVNALPANANSTAIFTTPPLCLAADNAQVYLCWFANIIVGTGTTILQFQVYRGTTVLGMQTGVAIWALNVVAGSTYIASGSYIDQPGPADLSYTLGAIQSGASAAGTLIDGCLLAFVL